MIPQVVASERGRAQTITIRRSGVVGLVKRYTDRTGTVLEQRTVGGESPVQEGGYTGRGS